MAENTSGDLPRDGTGKSGGSIDAGPDEAGMWLTASAWLPAMLLDALQEGASRDDDHALEAAFRQGGPLDAMPPGPVLAAFLSECSAPAPESGAVKPGAPEPLAARIASGADLARREDNALLGLIRGWRRGASLAGAAARGGGSPRWPQGPSWPGWPSSADGGRNRPRPRERRTAPPSTPPMWNSAP